MDLNPKLDSYDQGQMMEIIWSNIGNSPEYLKEVVIDKVILFYFIFCLDF